MRPSGVAAGLRSPLPQWIPGYRRGMVDPLRRRRDRALPRCRAVASAARRLRRRRRRRHARTSSRPAACRTTSATRRSRSAASAARPAPMLRGGVAAGIRRAARHAGDRAAVDTPRRRGPVGTRRAAGMRGGAPHARVGGEHRGDAAAHAPAGAASCRRVAASARRARGTTRTRRHAASAAPAASIGRVGTARRPPYKRRHAQHPVPQDARARQRFCRARLRAATPSRSTPAAARALADRHTGIGCDQLIVIEPPRRSGGARLHAHPQRRRQRGRGLRQRAPAASPG